MNDFAGLDFALGSVRGFRSWRIDVEGKLSALHRVGQWLPGENRAECQKYPNKEIIPDIEGESTSERQERVRVWKSSHDMDSCEHGFYAYFGASNLEDSYNPVVSGLIEGYGEVLIGTKGFRAAKARILALSVEPFQGIWNLDKFVVDKLRRNYPMVPIFESNFALLSEFPADNGAAITEATHV